MSISAPPMPFAPAKQLLYTAEELMAFPDDSHFELIQGVLVPMSPTGGGHAFTTSDLHIEIGGWVRRHDLGRCTIAEAGFLLARDPDTLLAPDFAFIAAERLPEVTPDGSLQLVPNLVIETRSPSDRRTQIANKIALWLSFGVTVVIDADPRKRTLTLHRADTLPITLGASDTLTLPDLLPGFSMPLSNVF